MSTITTLATGDTGATSRTVINTNFTNLNTDKIETSVLDTDTALTANSDLKVATQKAVKAYIDTSGGANASETARGIVEEATDAEVTAGTATGGTGAKLFVTPTKLNTRLNTGVSKKIYISPTEINNAGLNVSTEVTLFTAPIPANSLGTNNAIKVRVYISSYNAANAISATFRIKYGGTAVASMVIANFGTTVNTLKGYIEGEVVSDGATNAQKGSGRVLLHIDGVELAAAATVGYTKASAAGSGSAVIDSTTLQNLLVTVQYSDIDATNNFTNAEHIVVELVT